MLKAILSGLILGLALVFSMGPVVIKTIKIRINYGHLAAFFFIGGVWMSDAMWILIANLFGNFLEQLNEHKQIIGTIGGLILLSLGAYYLFIKKYKTKAEMDASLRINNATHLRLFVTGFLINSFNPGVIALWLATAAKTIGYTLEQKITTFAIALGLMILADVFKIELAGKIRERLTDKNIVILNRISGVLFLVFGIAFIIGANSNIDI